MGVSCTWLKLLTHLQIFGCKLHKNVFVGRAPPGPAAPSRYKGRERGERKGLGLGRGRNYRSCDLLVKVKLLRHYCCDYYGSVIWNSSHNSIEDICVAWRKGLRRILSLPYNTHSRLISPVCDFLPVREELICRCASFTMKCLNSCNSVVHFVSRNGIYGMRMHSPIGANVQGSDLLNILRQSYDYLTIVPKLRSTYDGRLVYQTSNEEREAFLKQDFLAKSQDLRR